jgi:hypothetical protein
VDKFAHQKATVRDANIQHAEFRVLSFVWSFMGKDGTGWVDRQTMYSECPVSKRKVDDALKTLVQRGYLTVLNPGGRNKGGRGKATTYALSLPDAAPAADSPAEPVDSSQKTTALTAVDEEGNHRTECIKPPHSVPDTTAVATENHRTDDGPIRSSSFPLLKSVKQKSRPTSPSPSSPAPVDNSCLPERPDNEEPDTAEAFDELDRLQANEHTPETPDYLASLDAFDPPEPTDAEDWGADWEPIGGSLPDEEHNVGRLKEIHEENNEEPPEAPAAALTRFRSRGHPARAQELASAMASGLRFPE